LAGLAQHAFTRQVARGLLDAITGSGFKHVFQSRKLVSAVQNTMGQVIVTESPQRASVAVFDPLKDAAYAEMLTAFPGSVPFHSRAWLSVIHDTYGHRPICFVAKDGRDIQAMLPMVEVQSWITGSRGVTLPFADYCPPMAKDAAALNLVLAEATKFAQQRGWKYLEIRGGRELMREVPASVVFYEHILDLSGGAEKLLARFESRMRGAIRKAEKEGLRVEVSNAEEAVRTYYALHCETRRKHGVPPQPYSFFQNLHRHFISKQSGIVVVAWHQNTPVAAAVFVHQGAQAVYKFSASNEAFLMLRGNNLVLWEAIRWYANHGFSNMHFGRTSLGNDGLRKYKIGWAAEESKLEYFRYSVPAQTYIVDTDRSEGGHNQLLSRLPRPLFHLAGRMLYGHLS
jgi:hypothetical protein